MFSLLIAWLGRTIVKKISIIGLIFIQLSLLLLTLSIAGTVISAFIYLVTWTYNIMINLSSSISNAGASGSCVFAALSCSGIFSAYQNAIDIVYVAIGIKFLLHIQSFFYIFLIRLVSNLNGLISAVGKV